MRCVQVHPMRCVQVHVMRRVQKHPMRHEHVPSWGNSKRGRCAFFLHTHIYACTFAGKHACRHARMQARYIYKQIQQFVHAQNASTATETQKGRNKNAYVHTHLKCTLRHKLTLHYLSLLQTSTLPSVRLHNHETRRHCQCSLTLIPEEQVALFALTRPRHSLIHTLDSPHSPSPPRNTLPSACTISRRLWHR